MKKDSERKPGKPAFDPKDLVDAPEWYDSHGNLDPPQHVDSRIGYGKSKSVNRQRRIQCEMEA